MLQNIFISFQNVDCAPLGWWRTRTHRWRRVSSKSVCEVLARRMTQRSSLKSFRHVQRNPQRVHNVPLPLWGTASLNSCSLLGVSGPTGGWPQKGQFLLHPAARLQEPVVDCHPAGIAMSRTPRGLDEREGESIQGVMAPTPSTESYCSLKRGNLLVDERGWRWRDNLARGSREARESSFPQV